MKLRKFYKHVGERFLQIDPVDLYELQRCLTDNVEGFGKPGRPGPGGGLDVSLSRVALMLVAVLAGGTRRRAHVISHNYWNAPLSTASRGVFGSDCQESFGETIKHMISSSSEAQKVSRIDVFRDQPECLIMLKNGGVLHFIGGIDAANVDLVKKSGALRVCASIEGASFMGLVDVFHQGKDT